jgi:hypothetical protein
VSTTPQRTRPVYFLRLESIGGDDIERLRLLLKALGLRYSLRCVTIEREPRPDSDGPARAPWSTVTPTDRAAKTCAAAIERLFGRSPDCEVFGQVVELIREALTEHETDVRREYPNDE